MGALENMHTKLNPSIIPLEMIVAESIDFLREYEPPDGYFVGFSGGKDSIVLLELCRMAGVKHRSFYSATGIDPPEIVRFIKRVYPEVTFLYPRYSFWEGIRRQSPPFRHFRWCCDLLKKEPSKPTKMEKLFGDPLRHRVMGIRAQESVKRASRPPISVFGGQTTYKPIFYWSEYQIWDFIRTNSLSYPCLYDEGFTRVGCMVCPFIMGRKKLDIYQKRWPAFYKIFEKVLKDWFDNYRKKDSYLYQNFDEYLKFYYSGECAPKVDNSAPLFDEVDIDMA